MGRCVLVNSVLDALPTYIMSAMELSVGIVNSLDTRRRAFLWVGEDKTSGSLCMVAWERCCQPKEQGGLGLKKLDLQN